MSRDERNKSKTARRGSRTSVRKSRSPSAQGRSPPQVRRPGHQPERRAPMSTSGSSLLGFPPYRVLRSLELGLASSPSILYLSSLRAYSPCSSSLARHRAVSATEILCFPASGRSTVSRIPRFQRRLNRTDCLSIIYLVNRDSYIHDLPSCHLPSRIRISRLSLMTSGDRTAL